MFRIIESGTAGRNLVYVLKRGKGILLPEVFSLIVTEIHQEDPASGRVRHDLSGSFATRELANARINNLAELE